jgi:hypothetical protein
MSNRALVSRVLYLGVMADGGGDPVRAFISYAHDSPAHSDLVREFWFFLHESGVAAWSDAAVAGQRLEWTRTMESALSVAEFVLVVASPEYRRRAAADRPGGETVGRGVEYEAGLIRERIYRDRHREFGRVLPVVLPGGSPGDVPDFLLPASSTVYTVSSFTVDGAESLLRVLTSQPSEIVPAAGRPPYLPPRPAPGDRRARAVEELVMRLRKLPAMETAQTRVRFRTMVAERRPFAGAVPGGGQDADRFVRALITALREVPGGLWALADTVHALHHGQPVDLEVRRLVEDLLIG